MDPCILFKAMSDSTRLRCLLLLSKKSELCVCEITQILDLSQPKVSHHLAALRKAGLVADRKEGLWIYYRINPDLPDWAAQVIQTTADGIAGQQPFAGDGDTLLVTNPRIAELCSSSHLNT